MTKRAIASTELYFLFNAPSVRLRTHARGNV